jgi:hypothetical protein
MFRRPPCAIVAAIVLTATLLAVPVSGEHPALASQSQEPIETVSVLGPVPPITPGGPAVKITLKNAGVEPVISLTATLEVETAFGTSQDFAFDVTPSDPLQSDQSTSATRCLIGGGFSNSDSYPLTINATLQNGTNFVYTKLVQIQKPLCFVATAAYDTPMADEVQILRDFRDEYLLTNPVGQTFVDLYYRVSPPMAKFITEHPTLKSMVRVGLAPAVAMSRLAVNTAPAEKAAAVGLFVLVSVTLVVWRIKRRRGPQRTCG